MSRAVAIGERGRVAGYALAGVEVLVAETPESAREALAALEGDVELLIVTPTALEALAEELADRPRMVWAVLPT